MINLKKLMKIESAKNLIDKRVIIKYTNGTVISGETIEAVNPDTGLFSFKGLQVVSNGDYYYYARLDNIEWFEKWKEL